MFHALKCCVDKISKRRRNPNILENLVFVMMELVVVVHLPSLQKKDLEKHITSMQLITILNTLTVCKESRGVNDGI